MTRGRLGIPIEVRFSSDSAESRANFEAELHLVQALQHPQIARFVEHGTLEGLPFYAVQHRRTLLEHLEEIGPRLPLKQTLRILGDIAAALAYCHQRGVFHCAINPRTVRADNTGGWLDEFGYAAAYSTLLRAGQMEGLVLTNPTYLPPELGPGFQFDGPSDIYSLGVTIFHCLAGEPPHLHAPDQHAAKQRHPTFPPAASAIEANLHLLLRDMLAPARDARPRADAVVAITQSLEPSS